MKKILSLLLAMLLVLSLAACGSNATRDEENDTPKQAQEAQQPEETKENQPEEQNKEPTAPMPIRAFVETISMRNSIRVWSEEVPELNCTVVLPESWNGKWDVAVGPTGVTVYSSEVRENNPAGEYTEGRFGGQLFNLGWWRDDNVMEDVTSEVFKVLRNDGVVLVEMDLSHDMQCVEETKGVYQAMTADLDQVQVIFDN